MDVPTKCCLQPAPSSTPHGERPRGSPPQLSPGLGAAELRGRRQKHVTGSDGCIPPGWPWRSAELAGAERLAAGKHAPAAALPPCSQPHAGARSFAARAKPRFFQLETRRSCSRPRVRAARSIRFSFPNCLILAASGPEGCQCPALSCWPQGWCHRRFSWFT